MYEELYQYLLYHKTLPVPGIGTFLLERLSAKADLPNRVINAPVYSISYRQEVLPFPKYFFSWLGHILETSDREANSLFNDFATKARKQVERGDQIHWTGVGTISKGTGSEIRFNPDPIHAGEPVRAIKVIRENAQHTIRVGEEEKSSAEMSRMLNIQPSKRSFNWLWPAVLIFLAVLFIGWYFSTYGVNFGSASNSEAVNVGDSARTYRVLQ